ncbi:MAG: hypothetical protein DRN49_00845 [Thaumarchaeota archaeon]|nr:MAG: hypothetical protein DRN49_00845 [Nitrososphaerota archaeon]
MLTIVTNPFVIFLILVVVLVISITALITSLLTIRRFSELVSQEVKAVERAPEKEVEQVVEKVSKEAAEVESKEAPKEAEVIKISGGFESLGDLATLTGMDSIFLFNLSGLPVDSYNMKEGERVAASLADFILTLRRLGFPADTIILKNGLKALLLTVKKVGDMEICALMVGKPEIDVDIDEIKELLQAYVSDLVGRREK